MKLLTAIVFSSLAVLLLGWSAPATAGTLLALCQGAAEVDVIDTATGAVSTRVKVDKVPAGIAISSDSTAAYITHPDIGLLTRLDVKTWTVAGTAHIGGQPFGIVAAGGALYVSDWSGDRILRIDARGLAVTGTLAVGRSPAHLAIDPDGRTLYSADREGDEVSIINTLDFTRTAVIPVGRAPYALDPSHPELVAVADVRSGDIALITKEKHDIKRIAGMKMPYGVAFVPGKGLLLATDQQAGMLNVIDIATETIIHRIRLGGSPEGVVVDAAAGRAYVAEWFANRVTALNLDDLSISTRIAVCDGPRVMALVP
ncbi:YncE family protein [Xanthobacter sp. 91]|uniref:YncE family protein n=1 Tax=Xanthobacter sp. 91 TaxID=1117244 RepID=UPI0006909818|nr:YncE family protein [Xanthobacter sp. 91]